MLGDVGYETTNDEDLLSQIEQQVRQDILQTRSREMSDLFIDNLISRYDIVVEETAEGVSEAIANLTEEPVGSADAW